MIRFVALEICMPKSSEVVEGALLAVPEFPPMRVERVINIKDVVGWKFYAGKVVYGRTVAADQAPAAVVLAQGQDGECAIPMRLDKPIRNPVLEAASRLDMLAVDLFHVVFQNRPPDLILPFS